MHINIYGQSTVYMALEILLVPLLWGAVCAFVLGRRVLGRGLNVLLLLIAAWGVLYCTLLTRTADVRSGLVSMPFQLLTAIRENREIIRSLLLNILLFCPFGAALVNLLPRRKPVVSRIITACMLGMILSILIEWTQFHFSLGSAEADDVICNTLGTLIGAQALPVKSALERKRS